VANKRVDLLERSLVEQRLEAFARRQLALLMLAVDGALAARAERLGSQPAKFLDALFGTHA